MLKEVNGMSGLSNFRNDSCIKQGRIPYIEELLVKTPHSTQYPMALPNPVIVIPGITASDLRDEYPPETERIWTLINKQYDRISLHPDNLRYEAVQPSLVRPDRVWGLVYKELVEELRHELTEKPDEPVPVYPFAYDWRQPLRQTDAILEKFIDEVIERTKLMPHYYRDGFASRPQVNLVGHSMGGIIAAGYLKRKGIDARVGKVATLGTPFCGSHEAVARVATGLDRLGFERSPSRERESARITPALYHLVPHYEGAVVADDEGLTHLFEPGSWQSSVLMSVEQYVRLYSVVPNRPAEEIKRVAYELFANMLTEAWNYRQGVETLDLASTSLESRDRWLCVAGVGEKTRVRTRIVTEADGHWFDLEHPADVADNWPDGTAATETGDGTVPYLGAKPPFLETENLICVSRHDFVWTEIADRAIAQFGGLHGALPLMNLNHRLIASHFLGRNIGDLWGRVPPDMKGTWAPPLTGIGLK
jgi:pimeloyl-ACP methyl ester carboxylesterase